MKKFFTLSALLGMSLLALAQTWDGTAEPWTVGDGTADNPYQIKTPGNLAYLIEQVNAGNSFQNSFVVLANDIDMAGVETLPIGKFDKYYDGANENVFDDSFYFLGTFDGNCHAINNLNIKFVDTSDEALGGTGLFACTAAPTVIRRVVLRGTVTGGEVTGGVVGQMTGGLVEECCNEMTINGESYTGGIVGVMENGTVRACCNHGAVNGATEIAGIVGQGAYEGSVSYCYNTAAVTSVGFGGAGIGGALYDTFAVKNCYSIGAITGNSSAWLGSPHAIVSDKDSGTTVSDCYYVADLTGVDDPNATAKTVEELKSAEILSLLNGEEDYFTFADGVNDGFPILKWQTEAETRVNNLANDAVLAVSGRTISATRGAVTAYDLCGKRVATGATITLAPGAYILTAPGAPARKLLLK